MKKFKLVIQSLPSTGKTTTMERLQKEGLSCVDSDCFKGKGCDHWAFGLVNSLLSTGSDILVTNLWLVGYADLLLEEDGLYVTLMPSDLKQYLINSKKDGLAGDVFDELTIIDWFHGYATSTDVRVMNGNHIDIPEGVNTVDGVIAHLETLTLLAQDKPSLGQEAVDAITQIGIESGALDRFPYKGSKKPPEEENIDEESEEGKIGEL